MKPVQIGYSKDSTLYILNNRVPQTDIQHLVLYMDCIKLMEDSILRKCQHIDVAYGIGVQNSVAEETGLKLALSETRRQVFSRRGPYNIERKV